VFPVYFVRSASAASFLFRYTLEVNIFPGVIIALYVMNVTREKRVRRKRDLWKRKVVDF